MVAYNNKKYYIDIVEAKPAMAVSIIETDCEVDFAPPLDYKEPEPVQRASESGNTASASALQDSQEPEEAKFNPFSGVGRRLDGKPSKHPAMSNGLTTNTVSPMQKSKSLEPRPATSESKPGRPHGKLVFGGGSTSGSTSSKVPATKIPVKEEADKEEKPKFQAFSGKKYSLR
ncbi:hypothetical protein KP509_17G022000 [Ceratopteris richardii]|nr:hypothetical protein KP509_17G022000 [Ceratopteris richardii]